MTLTDVTANELADHLYRNSPYDSPQIWMGFLSVLDPPTEITAVTNPGYVRTQIDDDMGPAVGGISTNPAEITLSAATDNWNDTIIGIGIWDADTAGNLLQVIVLPDPIDLVVSQAIRFPVGALKLGFATETQFVIVDERLEQAAGYFVTQFVQTDEHGDPSIVIISSFEQSVDYFVTQFIQTDDQGDPSTFTIDSFEQATSYTVETLSST